MDLETFQRAKCCISGRPLADCKTANVFELPFEATWHHPIITNLEVDIGKRAVAFIHDDYVKTQKMVTAAFKLVLWAIEIKEGEFIYHAVSGLQPIVVEADLKQVYVKEAIPEEEVDAKLKSIIKEIIDKVKENDLCASVILFDKSAGFAQSILLEKAGSIIKYDFPNKSFEVITDKINPETLSTTRQMLMGLQQYTYLANVVVCEAQDFIESHFPQLTIEQ